MGALLLYCKLLSVQMFSGTQVPSVQSVEDIVHFPFPTEENQGLPITLLGIGMVLQA